MIAFLIFLFILVPVVIIFLTERVSILNKIGAVIIAYVLGVLLGQLGLFPHLGEVVLSEIQRNPGLDYSGIEQMFLQGLIDKQDVDAFRVYKLQDMFTSLTVPLALPLLLFSLKIKVWFRMSGKTMLSMVLALVSVIVFIVLGHVIFSPGLDESNKIAGMLVGLYTGGTPNLASLKQSLGVDTETYIMTHTYDTAVGVLYLLFLVTVGKRFFRAFLPSYPHAGSDKIYDDFSFSEKAFQGFFKWHNIKGVIKALGVTFIIVAVSVGVGMMFKDHFMLVVILSITTLSIGAALIPAINHFEKTFEMGMYFVVVFSFVVASMADVRELLNISSTLIAYITLVYFGALLSHSLLCKVFKVDADTLMITSTALLCSPPFVPMVASALKNKEVIVAGLAVGIMGYAIGNYLGVILAGLLA